MKSPQAKRVYDGSECVVNVLLTFNLYDAILSENDLAALVMWFTMCIYMGAIADNWSGAITFQA